MKLSYPTPPPAVLCNSALQGLLREAPPRERRERRDPAAELRRLPLGALALRLERRERGSATSAATPWASRSPRIHSSP